MATDLTLACIAFHPEALDVHAVSSKRSVLAHLSKPSNLKAAAKCVARYYNIVVVPPTTNSLLV